jgi:hypothetical protein
MKKTNFIFACLLVLSCATADAGLLFNYSELALKDVDQLTKLVNDKIKESKRSSGGKVIPLREALQAVYSRPNSDAIIEKVVGPLRSQLDDLEAWEKTISQLTDEAIGALKHPNTFKPVVQGTYVFFLQNLLSEIKPLLKNDVFAVKITERIRDAKIQLSKPAQDEIRLRMMKSFNSPSDLAGQMLQKITEENVKTQKPVSNKTQPEEKTSPYE